MQLAVVVSIGHSPGANLCAPKWNHLVVLDAFGIVVEDQRACSAARLVDQATDLVVPPAEPAYPATIPILAPELRVDMADRVNGATNS
jgi:hypothetical protein